jgi:hypothetical protein
MNILWGAVLVMSNQRNSITSATCYLILRIGRVIESIIEKNTETTDYLR